MPDQLWFTHSPRNIDGSYGAGVRAASPGFREQRGALIQRVRTFLHYDRPEGSDPNQTPLDRFPVSFAYEKADGEWVLVNRVYTGADSTASRGGNLFCHLLAGLPVGWTARDAIALWGSGFWKTNTAALAPDGFDLNVVTEPDLVPGDLPQEALAMPDVRRHLPFIIGSYLTLKPGQSICIYGAAKTVAAFIWGLTRVLPDSLIENLSFSTFEKDIRQPRTVIVGTHVMSVNRSSWEIDQRRDVPYVCRDKHVALNCFSGNATPAVSDVRATQFAEFAVESLTGSLDDLTRLLAAARSLNTRSSDDFLKIAYLYLTTLTPGKLTGDELLGIILDRGLAAYLLPNAGMRDRLLAWVESRPAEWRARGYDAMKGLQQAARGTDAAVPLREALSVLCDTAFTRLMNHLHTGNDVLAFGLYRNLVVAITPDSEQQALGRLLAGVRPLAATGGMGLRLELLATVKQTRSMTEALADDDVKSWLTMPWTALAEFLAHSQVDDAWKAAAVSEAISGAVAAGKPLSASECDAVDRNSHLFSQRVREMVRFEISRQTGLAFCGLLRGSPALHAHMLQDLFREEMVRSDHRLCERLLGEIELPAEEERQFVETHITDLAQRLQDRPHARQLIERYMRRFTIADCRRPGAQKVMVLLTQRKPPVQRATADRGPQADDSLSQLVEAWSRPWSWLDPRPPLGRLPRVHEGDLALLPPAQREEARRQMLGVLVERIKSPTDVLDAVARHHFLFSRSKPLPHNSMNSLYGELLACALADAPGRGIASLAPYVEVGFTSSLSLPLQLKLNSVDLERIASERLRTLDQKSLAGLDRALNDTCRRRGVSVPPAWVEFMRKSQQQEQKDGDSLGSRFARFLGDKSESPAATQPAQWQLQPEQERPAQAVPSQPPAKAQTGTSQSSSATTQQSTPSVTNARPVMDEVNRHLPSPRSRGEYRIVSYTIYGRQIEQWLKDERLNKTVFRLKSWDVVRHRTRDENYARWNELWEQVDVSSGQLRCDDILLVEKV